MRREFTEPIPPQNGASPPALRPTPPIPRRNPRGSARSSRARLSASPAPDRSARLVPSRRLFSALPFAGPCLHAPDTKKVRNEMLVTDFH